MEFQQFYLGCLAHASYLIGSEGQAVVVDPRRDVDEYLEEARARGLAITFVVETHLHADFVSGYRELAERTGATVVFGARAEATFPHWSVREGDEIRVGRVILSVLETPGHTPESISLLVIDTEQGPEPRMVLTGDTLFIGDVGRPDLAGGQGLSAEAMAGLLYDSLHGKLLKLPDAVEVYPAHGAGSLCGRNISKETSSTIGEQRRTNYALRPMPRADFVRMMTVDLPEVPAYFPAGVQKNREGAPALGSRPRPPALDPTQVRALGDGVGLLDVRPAAAFGTGHLPGSIHLGLAGQFASWAGTLLPAERPLVIVAEDEGQVDEAALRLSRVGLENVAGYLEGGVAAWDRAGLPLAEVPQITVDELRAVLREDDALQVLDVRRPPEFAAGHVPRALSRPLDRLERELEGLDPARPTAVLCAGGYRSSAGTSLLLRHGFRNLRNVVGGTSAWTAAGYPTEPGDARPVGKGASMNEYRERILGLLADRPALDVLLSTPARIEALVARLGAAGLSRPWAPGKWTAGQILAHLADAEIAVGFRLRQALAEPDHVAQAFDQDLWAARYPSLDGQAAVRAFCAVRLWNLELIRTLDEADLARPFMHPERGMESVGIIVRMLAGHDLNHLAQLEQVPAA